MSPFVTFEGIEGSGKSTQLRQLAAELRRRGRDVLETREPGATRAGAAIRDLLLTADGAPLTPLAELFLYCADRTQHLDEIVRPALAAGRVVLCDRFSDSTIAYQGYGRGLPLDTVRALDASARRGLEPTLTILLDCPAGAGLARARGRSRSAAPDRFEAEANAFHERVRAGFLELAAASPTRFVVVDAGAPLTEVGARVLAAAERHLERTG